MDKDRRDLLMSKSADDLASLLQNLRSSSGWKEKLLSVSERIYNAFGSSNKLLLIGNGGSAAQAQHIAAEFVNRFLHERRALPALSLTTDTSNITSISNDYSFDLIFEKQLEALGRKGDILLCLSTSGGSINIINCLIKAQKMGIYTFSLLGKYGGDAKFHSDSYIIVDSESTPRIQELHIFFGHIICQLVEEMVVYGHGD